MAATSKFARVDNIGQFLAEEKFVRSSVAMHDGTNRQDGRRKVALSDACGASHYLYLGKAG